MIYRQATRGRKSWRRARSALAAVALLSLPSFAFGQASTIDPTQPVLGQPVTPAPIQNQLRAAASDINGLLGMHAGISAPPKPVQFQLWVNTSLSPSPINIWTGSTSSNGVWVPIGYADVSGGLFVPPSGGGADALASAATVDLGASTRPLITISGSTTISSFGATAAAGTTKIVIFSGALQLTYNGTSLITPTGASITTAAGDTAILASFGSGNWAVVAYQRASGAPLLITRAQVIAALGYTPANKAGDTFSGQVGVNLNATALPTPQTGAVLQGASPDGTSTRTELDSFGAASFVTTTRADGTNAAKTALLSGDQIGGFNAFGWNGSAYVGPSVSFRTYADENWSSGHQGSRGCIGVTANGTTTIVDEFCLANDGGATFGSPTGGDKGVGTVNAQGVYVNGAPAVAGTVPQVQAQLLIQPAPQGRLTLTSGVPVPTADVAAATTIYYAPFAGPYIPIYNGAQVALYQFTSGPTDAVGLSLALDPNSAHTGYQAPGSVYDLFVFLNSGTATLGSGPAWSSTTARGTGAGTTQLSLYGGLQTNAVSITLRFGTASGNTAAVAANQATYVGSLYVPTATATTVSSQLSGATTLSLAAPLTGPGLLEQFYVAVDSGSNLEYELVTGGFGTSTLTVTRGQLGTSAVAHTSAAVAVAGGQTAVQLAPSCGSGGSNNLVGLWNAYNRIKVVATGCDSTVSWAYTSAVMRPADNSTGNRITFIDGLEQSPLYAFYFGTNRESNASVFGTIAVGWNSTTTLAGYSGENDQTTAQEILTAIAYSYPLLGLNFMQALEETSGSTSTFYGTGTTNMYYGLQFDQ